MILNELFFIIEEIYILIIIFFSLCAFTIIQKNFSIKNDYFCIKRFLIILLLVLVYISYLS